MLRNRLHDVQIFWIVARGAILAFGAMVVGALEETHDLSVVCSIVGGVAELHPEGSHSIVAGEKLLILCSRESLSEVQKLNRQG